MKRPLACAVALAAALLSAPTTAHADEGIFTPAPLPFLWPTADLLDVAADGPGGIWIGGNQGAYCVMWWTTCGLRSDGNPVARRWDGSVWKEYPLNGWTGQGRIQAIATSGGETWIGGASGSPGSSNYLARFDGTAFQEVEKPAGADIDMISTGPAGTWVAQYFGSGEFQLHKRTGSSWTGYPLAMRHAKDVQARTATDAWVVGSVGDTDEARRPAIAHWDGAAWTSVTPPPVPAGTPDEFVKVVPVGANDVWALTRNHLTRWNGTDWTLIRLPSALGRAGDLAVDGNGVPWVAADHGMSGPYRYSGGTWQSASLPATLSMNEITAVPGTSTVWGVANNGAKSAPAVLRTP